MPELLPFPRAIVERLEPYLPSSRHFFASIPPSALAPTLQPASSAASSRLASASPSSEDKTWLTLTFATSLDSSLALSPGVRTILSGSGSKAMTHYLRSRHDAILIGVGTAVADGPGLNCRIAGSQHQPRPIVLDPNLRWELKWESKVLELVRRGEGLAPYIFTSSQDPDNEKLKLLEEHGGKVVYLPLFPGNKTFSWVDVLGQLSELGLKSVMVEGGGSVINSLLTPTWGCQNLVDSVIVTIAPTWLGQGGVVVSPPRERENLAAARLKDVVWLPMGEDVVLCGRLGG